VRRLHARWVLPIAGPPIRDGTVVIDHSTIRWVGARHEAPPATHDIELGDALLLPGLVNTHIHLDLAALGDAVATREFFPWIRRLVALTSTLDPSLLRDAARWAVRDQLRHGVTTMADTAPNQHGFDAMREMGVRGIAFREVFGPADAQCDAALAHLERAVTVMRRDETSRVLVGVSPHAPYSVSDRLYRATATYARREALPVAVHIAESVAESSLITDGDGPFAHLLRDERGVPVSTRARSPIALLERTQILATRPLCIHAVHADAHDIAQLAAARASVAHCPCSNAWFGHGAAPVAAYRAAGVTVGLGTDSIASNDQVRLLVEARAATDPTLTPHDRIALATRGGAAALRLDDRIGVLQPGFAADLCAFAVTDPTACDADPAAYLLEQASRDRARFVMVAGIDRTPSDADDADVRLPRLP
jgi:aminodeoxyfutalosine deaminase